MDKLKIKRQTIMDKIAKYQAKLFDLQNILVNIEQSIVDMDYKEIIDSLTLNEQQLSVVNSKEKNTLVIAAPGSGKTHTLISTYIKLIVEDKIDPQQVIMITFTKKAGQEMMGRLSSLIPTKLPSYVGSLHGFSYRILQEFKNINYTILDERETRDLIKDTCEKYLDIDNESYSLVKSKMAIIIDQASSVYPFNLLYAIKKFNLDAYENEFKIIINKYNERKVKENLLDFNDLMIMFCEFLDSNHSNILKDNIKYIFFDEYQDVNPIQHYILSKFKNKSTIMVVGDDAQAIYAFRGSSVKFIMDFPNEFKPNKVYLLENNYRSTKEIVSFFQDTIKKNTSQYNKNVIATSPNKGIKPIVIGFDNHKKRDQWIINDIFKNKKNNIPLSKMVILARKNESLDKIEIELVKQGITVIKHTGLSILDKSHIKDFLAFIIILINEKSTLHWKRILSLHSSIGVNTANEIIENNNNPKEAIKKLKDTQVHYANQLKELDSILNLINNTILKMKDIDKARHILSYLEKLWSNKYDTSHLQEKIKDVLLLISYINQSNLKDFINDLYLNQSIETNLDNTIYLTTIHGSKGLEWDYVYLIDVDSENFPSMKKNYYLIEGADMEEERRLFYVACSRAKFNLVITYTYSNIPNNLISMSPFIRELDNQYYTGINVNYSTYKMSGNISYDVNNYLKFFGFCDIYPMIKDLETERYNLHSLYEIPKYLDKFRNTRIVIGNFFDYLLAKMIQINFSNEIKQFELNTISKLENFPQKIRQNYNDELTDWRNLLRDIFYVSIYNLEDNDKIFDKLEELLINENIYKHYSLISEKLSNYIRKLKPKNILSHYNVSFGNVRGEIDLLVDDTIIEFKTNQYEIATISNITQTLVYAYLLTKKDKPVNRIVIYNPISGEINEFNIKNFNFKKIANYIYGHFKK